MSFIIHLILYFFMAILITILGIGVLYLQHLYLYILFFVKYLNFFSYDIYITYSFEPYSLDIIEHNISIIKFL